MRATREGYDAVAELYTDVFKRSLAENPFDRAMLDIFADLVGDSGAVVDIGCGPGRITGYLHAAGLRVSGIDLSPEMIRLARRDLPQIGFEVGSMERLELADASLAGIVAWYSIIHTPPERVPAVFAEFARVLRPGGQLLLAFQSPTEPVSVQRFDHKVTTGYRWSADAVAEVLDANGFRTTARLSREARTGENSENSPQGAVLAERL